MFYVGIDPGKSGAIAWVSHDGAFVYATKMPEDAALLADKLGNPKFRHAIVERVHSSTQMGVVSSFTFGRGFGRLEGVLATLKAPHSFVTPQRWQTDMDCRTGGDKDVTKRKAQQMFPGVKVTLWNADALLLAAYCRQLHMERCK